MYSYRTGLGQVWVGAKLPPNSANNIIWLRPSDDHRVLWEIRTYNIYEEKWEVLTSAALTAEGLLKLIYELEKRVDSLEELKVVLYDRVQSLTDDEKKTARENIGALGEEDLPEIVQEPGSDQKSVMSQDAVTKYTKTAVDNNLLAAKQYTDVIVRGHNTSSTSHVDIRELLNTCVGLPAYDSSSYKITFTTLAGATVEIDLPIEQLALRYNAETESIEFDNADGTTTSIPVSAFVKEYVGSIGNRIQVSIDENNVIHATILKNSIDWDCLSFELQERINDHVTSADFATKVVRTDIAQTLSAAQQEQAWLNLGLDLVVLKFPEGATSVTLTDEEDAKLAAGAAVLMTVDGTNTGSGVYNADNHIFVSSNFATVSEPLYFSLWSYTSALYCSYKKASKTFVYYGSLQLNDTGALRTDRQTTLTSAKQSQAFENLGWKVHVISESVIGSSDAISDDEKAARLSATALLVQETSEMYNFGVYEAGVRKFFGNFTNAECTSLLVDEESGAITTNTSWLHDRDAVSFSRDQSSVSDDNKNKALSNIGLDFVRLPYSLLNTTLSDEMAEVIDNARGIILVDTPNDFIVPTIYNKGRTTSTSAIFIAIGEIKDVYYISYNKNTKALATVVHNYTDNGCVRYIQEQGLTNTQKDTVLSNIGLNFVHVDYSLLGTTLDDSTAALVENANGIIVTNTPESYNKAMVFSKTNYFNDNIYFNAWNGVTLVSQFYYTISTKKLTTISNTDLHFDSVRYTVTQSLTDAQKSRARANINAVGSNTIKGVEIVYETAPMQEDNILYIELEETT